MALPPSLRYLPARLRPLGSPLVWCPVLALALLAAFIWEYRNNPTWLESLRGSPTLDEAAVDDEGILTPEEEADALDLQSLDALLRSVGANPEAGSPSLLQQAGGSTPNAVPGASTGASTLGDGSSASGQPAGPFAAYLDQYRFIGAGPANSDSSGSSRLPNAPASPQASSPQPLIPGLAARPAEATGRSALGQAIADRLQNQNAVNQPARPAPSANGNGSGNGNSSGSSSGSSNGTATSAGAVAPFSQQGVSPAQLPGGSVNFLRTTPEMSPPPGTTGYRPPASINLPQFNNAAPVPAAPTAPGAIGANGTLPRQPVAPNANLPNVRQTLPPPSVPPSVGTQPSPFSVSRPPGGRPIGGGQINTFSDPLGVSAPPQQSR